MNLVSDSANKMNIFFFFQAEDGIRDYKVTGVQTCALPIYARICRRSARSKMPSDVKSGAAECNCHAVRAAARHITQAYDQFLAPAGLRTNQFSILAKLKRQGPLTINALAAEMVMDRT